MSNILLTGASGFVGSSLLNALGLEHKIVSVLRKKPNNDINDILQVNAIDASTDYSKVINSIDVVIHTAARAHVMKDESTDPLSEYRTVNLDGTLNLARQAAEAGVKRFIFISSIKVNGEQTKIGSRYKSTDTPAPEDPYGISKYEAEQGLLTLAQNTQMEVVIIRPPLVYGPGVKGNFASMIKLVKKGIPLPLGAIHNQRTLVGLDNLVDLISTCIDHPAAANQVFLAGDGQDMSTTELLQNVAKAMGKPSRLIPVPASLLMLSASVLGKKAVAKRLLGSLQVDISKTKEVLSWEAPVSVEEGLKRCFVNE